MINRALIQFGIAKLGQRSGWVEYGWKFKLAMPIRCRIQKSWGNKHGFKDYRNVEVSLKERGTPKLRVFAYTPNEAMEIVRTFKRNSFTEIVADPNSGKVFSLDQSSAIDEIKVRLDPKKYPQHKGFVTLEDAMYLFADEEVQDAITRGGARGLVSSN